MTVLATRSMPASTTSDSAKRLRLRPLIGPSAAIATIFGVSLLAAGGLQMGQLVFSACMIISAIITTMLAGPRHVRLAMAAAPVLLLTAAAFGIFGSMQNAAGDLAVLLGMVAAWTTGFLAMRERGNKNFVWSGLVWAMLLYAMWIFFTQIGTTLGSSEDKRLSAGFSSPADAGVLFGALALIGSARVMHVIKQMDAAALSRSEMIDRLLRDGLGGTLLAGFSLTCLAMTGSHVGLLLAGAAIIFHAWWDLSFILRRDHRATWIQALEKLTPVVALAAVGLAFYLAFQFDESVAAATPGAGGDSHIQRLAAYWATVSDQLFFGHGLGAIDAVRDRIATLQNYVALEAPGDARNLVLNWLVEVGLAGLLCAIAVLATLHLSLLPAFRAHSAPRSLPRLAIMTSVLLLLHGLADSSLGIPALSWIYALILGCACGVAALQSTSRSLAASLA